jgi:hypothetical protein
MKKTTIMSLLLLSTLSVTPAFANYFANPRTNTMLNVGSAPSPTPQTLRAIGDSNYAPSAPYYGEPARPLSSNASPAPFVAEPVAFMPVRMKAIDVEYKHVFGVRGERLGTVIAFNEKTQQAELQLSTGVAISMPATLITESRNGRLMAATVSHNDVLAMAKTQTGRVVATNLRLGSRNTRA